ncbi:hypothetical protein [Tropicibacter alexandrii]|uniref:hypothetical protein n=1 Tax=Tropicibacter alexandrii TaxID=2267683 RepID=UPI001008946B|nr:hypothetical protein [Tropicibacter alexandrii]
MSFRFEPDRRRRTALVVLLAWVVILGLSAGVGMAWWIALPLWVVTLPAAWEALHPPDCWLEIDAAGLRATLGGTRIEVPRDQIARARIDTRLDLSLRLRLYPDKGPPVRIPTPCLPDGATLEEALTAQGIKVERHHFSAF